MIYKSEASQTEIYSLWQCGNVDGVWKITSAPIEGWKDVTFAVMLPSDAVITRAWVEAKLSEQPKGGIDYFRVNGQDVPESGEVAVSLTTGSAVFTARFVYKSNGEIVETEGYHYGTATIEKPTLYVEYTEAGAGGDDSGGSGGGDSGDDSGGGSDDGSVPALVQQVKSLRLPRLLDADLREKARLHCSALSVTENVDPLSTAEMTLPHNAAAVNVDDYVEIFTPYGSAGIYRVYQTTETVLKNRRCALRHGIVTLADDLVLEGNAITAPVAEVFASLFGMQTITMWQMGDCAVPSDLEIVLERNHQTLLHAFTDLTSKLPDGYAWQFDQRTRPWKAHLRAMPTDDACEFRMSRDITGMTIRIDRDSQCTRVYAYGAGEGSDRIGLTNLIGTPYLDAEGADKVIAKAITNEDVYDALTLRTVAEKYLERHKDPTVSIDIDAANLYRQTGLTLDKFQLGMVCRVPLPMLKRTIREKVISIRWRDLIKSPDAVTATLANRLRTMSDEMADLMREATNSKLIGGTVESKTTTNNSSSVTQGKSLVHYFDITGYGNTLAVLVDYTPAGECRINVDSTWDEDGPVYLDHEEVKDGHVNILKYLTSDENGVPKQGQHSVQFFARGTGTISVHSEVTVKTVEKR